MVDTALLVRRADEIRNFCDALRAPGFSENLNSPTMAAMIALAVMDYGAEPEPIAEILGLSEPELSAWMTSEDHSLDSPSFLKKAPLVVAHLAEVLEKNLPAAP